MKPLALLLLSTLSLVAQPVLTVALPASVQNGATNTGTISLAGSINTAALQFTIALPSFIALPGSTPSVAFSETAGPAAAGKSVQCSIIAGLFTCAVGSASDVTPIGNGVLATFVFIVNGAPAGPATVSVTNVSGSDPTGQPVSFPIVAPITITVSSGTCDLNGDAQITATDWALVLNQVLGLAACTNGDINKDGKCNVQDLVLESIAVSTQTCPVP